MNSAFGEMASFAPNSGGARIASLPPRLRAGYLGLLRITGQQRKDAAFYCDHVGREVAAMELSYPARFAAAQRLKAITNAPNRFCVFSDILLSSVPRLDPREADHVARVRVAATVLAVERYRLAHANVLPDSLAQLTPTWLQTPLLDPFNGQPLHYKTHGASYAVYSVGSDLQDNGGVDWSSNCFKSPLDISILVKH